MKIYFIKDAHQKSKGGGHLGQIKKKLDSFTLKTSKNYLIRNFLRNERVRVNLDYFLRNDFDSQSFSYS